MDAPILTEAIDSLLEELGFQEYGNKFLEERITTLEDVASISDKNCRDLLGMKLGEVTKLKARVAELTGSKPDSSQDALLEKLAKTTAEQATFASRPYMRKFGTLKTEYDTFLKNLRETPAKEAGGKPGPNPRYVQKCFLSALKAKEGVSPELAMLIPYLLHASVEQQYFIAYILLTKPMDQWVLAHNLFVALQFADKESEDNLFIQTNGEALVKARWPIFPDMEEYDEYTRQVLTQAESAEDVTGGQEPSQGGPSFLSASGGLYKLCDMGRKKVSVSGGGILPIQDKDGSPTNLVLETTPIEMLLMPAVNDVSLLKTAVRELNAQLSQERGKQLEKNTSRKGRGGTNYLQNPASPHHQYTNNNPPPNQQYSNNNNRWGYRGPGMAPNRYRARGGEEAQEAPRAKPDF